MVLINRQIMNDYERFRQCSTLDPLAPHYPWADRSMSMAVSHAMRSDLRNCPTRQPRNVGPSDPDPESNAAQPRRRIAVACARCRKRKIRCSGDPGNNSGCQNCRAAGADVAACQFNRVGSYVPRPNSLFSFASPLAAPSLSMNSMYQGQSGDYSYAPPQKSVLPTRSYSHYSSVGYSDDTSVDSFAYQPLPLPTNDMLATGFMGGVQEPMRSWSSMGHKQPAPSTIYLDEPSTASYSNVQLPYLNTAPVTRQPTLAAENMSAFSMNSLQSSLASPPPPPPPSIEDRHLPVPTTTRVQMTPASTLHLRAQQTPIASPPNTLSYSKSSTPAWSQDSTVQENRRPTSTINSNGLSSNLAHCQVMSAPVVKTAAVPSLQDSVFNGYIPIANSSPESSSIPSTSTVYTPSTSTVYTPSTLSGATSSSLSLNEKYASSGVNVVQPTSSTREDALQRSDSTTNFSYYATEASPGKRTSDEQSSQANRLVSGQRYAPLQAQTSHNSSGLDSLRRDSFDDSRADPAHRGSVSSLGEPRY